MATGISSAAQLRDHADWSKSHRVPPPIPTTRPASSSSSLDADIPPPVDSARPSSSSKPSSPRTGQLSPWPIISKGGGNDAGGYVISHHSRTRARAHTTTAADNTRVRSHSTTTCSASASASASARRPSLRGRFRPGAEPPRESGASGISRSKSIDLASRPFRTRTGRSETPPPLPVHTHIHVHSTLPRKSSVKGDLGKMLRKVSRTHKKDAEEKERLKRERDAVVVALPRQPPHLPSMPSLHGISHFGASSSAAADDDSDSRPDSVAIFNSAAYVPTSAPQIRSTANFSRPGTMAPAPSTGPYSSSPAYTNRGLSFASSSSPPDPRPRPNGIASGEYVAIDSVSRTESMTHRGRFSYASNSTTNVNAVHSPRRVRRKKDPTPFNIMVIGAKNSGKTSFISFLKHSLALPADKPAHGIIQPPETAGVRSSFTSSYLETEIEGERIGLTLWDSAGLEKNIADLQLREMTAFIESKFEETFAEEQKVSRTPGSKDTHIHCVFLLLDPVDLDSSTKLAGAPRVKPSQIVHPYEDENLQAMRALWGKTTVIPVISKADTVTIGHMSVLKRGAWDAIKSAKLDPLEALELEDDGDDDDADDGDEGSPDEDTVDSLVESDSSLPQPKSRKNHHRQSSLSLMQAVTGDDLPYLPMSIISPDPFDMPPFVAESKFPGKIGRRFPWGFADSHNPEHCDFNRLRDSVFSEWRVELRELSRTRWYESWRTARLKNVPGSSQRIRGGVTPVTAVPKEGRIASQPARKSSLPALNRPTVPRSASTTANPPVNGHIVGLAIDSPDSSGPSETAPPTRRPSAAGPIRSSESQR